MKKSDRRKLNELDKKIDILTNSILKLSVDMSKMNNAISIIKNTVDGQVKQIEDSWIIKHRYASVDSRIEMMKSTVDLLLNKMDVINSSILTAHQSILNVVSRGVLNRY